MPFSRLTGNKLSQRLIIITVALFILIITVAMVAVYLVANRTRNLAESRQMLTYTTPIPNQSRQIRRILLKRHTANGDDYLEILSNGTVNQYDGQMNLIRTSLLGYARVNSLFNDLINHWDRLGSGFDYSYTLTIETEQGTTTFQGNGNGSGNDLIDEINHIGDDAFAPTPTPVPSATPYQPPPGSPSLTPTSIPPSIPTPTITPGGPTPLPPYQTAPPFTCSEYANLGHPVIISNVICGTN